MVGIFLQAPEGMEVRHLRHKIHVDPLLIFFVNVTTLFNSTSLIFREPSDQDQPGVHPLNQPIDPNKNQ